MAVLKCVRGNILQMGCNQVGKVSMGKKVPANKNWGRVIKFAKGGMVLSVFATLLTIKPKPMNKTKARKLSSMMLKKVSHPCTNVN